MSEPLPGRHGHSDAGRGGCAQEAADVPEMSQHNGSETDRKDAGNTRLGGAPRPPESLLAILRHLDGDNEDDGRLVCRQNDDFPELQAPKMAEDEALGLRIIV